MYKCKYKCMKQHNSCIYSNRRRLLVLQLKKDTKTAWQFLMSFIAKIYSAERFFFSGLKNVVKPHHFLFAFFPAALDGSPEAKQAEESEDGGQPAWQHRILKRSAPSTEVQIQ